MVHVLLILNYKKNYSEFTFVYIFPRADWCFQTGNSLYNNILFFHPPQNRSKNHKQINPQNPVQNPSFTLYSAQLIRNSLIATRWATLPPMQEHHRNKVHSVFSYSSIESLFSKVSWQGISIPLSLHNLCQVELDYIYRNRGRWTLTLLLMLLILWM